MPTLSELPEDPSSSASPSPSTSQTSKKPLDDDAKTPKVLQHDDDEEPSSEIGGLGSIEWSKQELQDIVKSATALKVKGNAEFGHGQWGLALGTYREGLGELPPRKETSLEKGKGKAALEEGTAEVDDTKVDMTAEEEGETESAEDKEISSLRAVLSANVAACLLKLNRWKDAVKACDDALQENPTYFKALHRRAMANESIGSWSSLSASLEDFNKLATLPDLTPLLARQVKQAQTRIPRAIEKQQQKEKDEVMGKLKDLGNTVLGKFGFSLDNFKMTEQPGGGYSMNFQQ